MSDRGLPITDGAHACPFVAFEDDRDERASVPDHRHRCYAEAQPAPRALAHQEAYCLSSAFPVCPTFQDWARREAARARGGSEARTGAAAGAAASSPTVTAASAVPPPEPEAAPERDLEAPDFDEGGDSLPPAPPPRRYDDGEVRRNPPRDWSAPPPWLASSEGAGGPVPADPPSFLASRSQPGQGLAGSTADQWAGGAPPSRPAPRSADIASVGAAGAAGAAGGVAAAGAAAGGASPASSASAGSAGADRLEASAYEEPHQGAPPPAGPRRPRAYDQHLGGPSGPDWERPRRYEAYPTIRTRVGIPAIPRLAAMAAALGIAAVALFFLPALLGLGGPDAATSSPSPTPQPSRSIAPTPTPAPTPAVYVIQAGDTLSKIATDHGLTLDQLMAANPDITDPNRIVEGQQITIPVPSQAPPDSIGGSAAPPGSPGP